MNWYFVGVDLGQSGDFTAIAVVERVVQVTRSGELDGRCHLAVDGTGVGRPVVDLLRRARPNCVLLPAIITGGDEGVSEPADGRCGLVAE